MSLVIVTERDDLKSAIREVLQELGVVGKPVDQVLSMVAEEVPTNIARKLLTEKGYSVKSFDGLRSVLERHNVTGTMRGRVMWYKSKDVVAIPAMK